MNKKITRVATLFCSLLLLFASVSIAQVTETDGTNTITLTGTGTFNWSSFTASPTSSYTITVGGGVTLSVNSTTATCGELILGDATAGDAVLTFAASSDILTVSGASGIVLGASGGSKGDVEMSSGGSLSTTEFTSTNAGTSYAAGGTITLTATGALPGYFTSFSNLTINNTNTVTTTGNFGVTGTLTLSNGGSLTLGALITSAIKALTLSGGCTLTCLNYNISGTITTLTTSGGGVATFSGGAISQITTYNNTGGTTLDLVQCNLQNIGTINSSGTSVVEGNGIVGSVQTINVTSGTMEPGAPFSSASIFTVNASGNFSPSVNMSGTISTLNLKGGNLQLDNEGFAATVTVNSLIFSNAPSQVQQAGKLIISDNGMIQSNISNTTLITTPTTLQLGLFTGNPITISAEGNTISCNISGSEALHVGGPGLVLSGNNTYSGGTTIQSGTIYINSPTALGTGAIIIDANTTIDNTSSGSITLTNNNTQTWSGSFTYGGTKSLNMGTGAITLTASPTITLNGLVTTLTEGGVINDNVHSLTTSLEGILSLGSQAVQLNSLTIGTGTSFVSTTNTLSLPGNFSNSGTFTNNNGTVTLTGSGKTIGGSTITTFNKLNVNGSTSLLNSETVANQLGLSAILTLGSYNLTLGSGAIVSGGGSSSYIATNGTGALLETYAGTATYTFPVGALTSGDYTPVSLAATSGTNGATISVLDVHSKEPHNNSSTYYLNRYWKVTGSSPFSGTITGNFLAADVANSPESSIATGIYTLPSGPWTKYGSGLSGTSLSAGVSSFSSGDVTGMTNAVLAVTIAPGTTACSLEAVTTGGDQPISYVWVPSSTSSSVGITTSGTYSVTVTDGNGLTATASENYTVLSIAGVTTAASSGCSNTGSATVSISGGLVPYSYSWSDGSANSYPNAPTIGNLAANTYTVTVTDANKCKTTASTTISQLSAISISTPQIYPSCNGGNSNVILNSSGGASPYTYSWSNGTTMVAAFSSSGAVLSAGTYTILVTDVNNCSASISVSVIQPNPISLGVSETDASCNGANGSATASASGGGGSFIYQWNDASSTQGANLSAPAGTYTVTVTDANSCTATTSTTISQPSGISLSVSETDASCNGANGSATASASGGGGSFIYQWNDASSTQGANLSAPAGTYTVTVTDANSCTATASTTISQPSPVTASATVIQNATACANNGSATATAGGGNGGYTYLWNDGASQTNTTANNLAGGTYTVTVTDVNGCTATTSVTITQPSIVTASATIIQNATACANNGSAMVTAGGGNSPYTYSWNDNSGQATATSSNLAAGNYTVTISDNNGCSATASVTITQPSPITATAIVSGYPTPCYDSGYVSVLVNGGISPYTYSWNDLASQTTQQANNIKPGNYTVTVTDSSGCTATSSVSVSQPATFSITVTSQPAPCYGYNGIAEVTLNGAVPPYEVSWTGPGGYNHHTVYATANFSDQISEPAGTYTVTGIGPTCTRVTYTVAINQPASSVTANAAVTQNAIACANNGQATVTAGGGTSPYTYSWNDNSSQTTQTASNLGAGTYSVTVTDNNGCTAISSAIITQPSAITATISANQNATACSNNGSATVTAGGGESPYTYSWNDNSNQATAMAGNLAGGNYTVTVTDANGCYATASVTITQAQALTATMGTPVNSSSCGNVGSAMVIAGGGNSPYTYSWNDNPSQATATASNLAAGNYTVTVTDNNGCGATASVTISQSPALTATMGTPVNSSPCFNTGSATVIAGGGISPYTYSWNANSSQATASNLSAGNYTVTVTDNNGCTATAGADINLLPLPTISFTSQPALCNGGNGTATGNIVGGFPPYLVEWSLPGGGFVRAVSSTPNYTTTINKPAGTYTLSVTGCDISDTVSIHQPVPISASLSFSNVTCNGANNGIASIIATGGRSPYTYQWVPDNQTTASATGLSAGSYAAIVFDSCGGSVRLDFFTITQPDAVSLTASVIANLNCNNVSTGSASATATGGNSPYTYSWSGGGGNSSTASNLSAGTFTITATDANGCSATSTVTITEPTALTASVAQNGAITCNGGTTTVTVSGNGGTSPYGETGTFTVAAGTYSYTVTDANGCTAIGSITITQPSPLTAGQQEIVGLTYGGGINGNGTIFSYNIDSANERTLKSFTSGTDGSESYDRFILDPNNGSYYAMNSVGGTQNGGTIVKFNPVTSAETIVWNFGSGADGTNPQGNLIYYAPTGLFYGMTANGANGNGPGIIFSFSPITNTESVLWTLGTGTDGANPYGSLVLDPINNIFYGVTDNGGSNGYGTIISFNPSAGSESVVYSFGNLPDGQNPYGSIVFNSSDGNFYGLTSRGGAYTGWNGSAGTIFKFNPVANTESVQWNFGNGTDAMQPTGDLVYNPANNFYYGMATFGGTNGQGAIFSFDPTANAESVAWSFDGAPGDGANPFGDLTYNSTDGLFYGVTPYSGQYNNEGILFNFNPSTNSESVLWNFGNGSDGGYSFGTGGVTIINVPGQGANALQNVSCNGGNNGNAQAYFTGGSGNYRYSWSNGTSSVVSTSNPTGNVLSAGSYTVTVTDVNGCNATASVTITQPLSVGITISSVTNGNCSASTGSATANAATGGISPYTYSWSSGRGTNLTATNLSGGSYTITVTDNHGCNASASVTITQSTSGMGVSIASVTNISCHGSANGSAAAVGSGGTLPYTYSWNNGRTTASATGLSAGTYSVTIKSAGGCSGTASVTITQPATALTIITTEVNVSACSTNNGSAMVTADGGTSPYTYSWTGARTTASVTGLSAGTYTITLKDKNGCNATASVTVGKAASLSATASVTGVSCHGGGNGAATVTISGGSSPYTYRWGSNCGSKTTATVTGLSAGTYTVIATDNRGCTVTSSAIITQPAIALSASTCGITNLTCNGGDNGIALGMSSGGTSPYTYHWNNGKTTATATGLSAGTYTLTVTDHNGCTASVSAAITQPTAITISHTQVNVTTNGGTNGSATASASGGVSPYGYKWSSNCGSKTTATVTGLSAGTYTVTVTDAHKCTAMAAITITQPAKTKSPETNGEDSGSVSQCCPDRNVNLYPNPNTGQFTIAGIMKGMIIEVYDYTGRKICFVNANEETTWLNISTQPNGVYLIRILDKEGNLVSQKKVIKTE